MNFTEVIAADVLGITASFTTVLCNRQLYHLYGGAVSVLKRLPWIFILPAVLLLLDLVNILFR